MSVVRVKGRVGMRDVIRGIRFAGGGQPRSLLDTQAVFGSAALEGVVTFRVDGIGQKVGDQGVRRGAGEHLVPVVSACGRDVSIQFERP